MTILTEWETDVSFGFDVEALAERVIAAACDAEECPYETQVNLPGDRPAHRRIVLSDAEL